MYTLYNMKTPKPSPTITAHLLAIKQALATSPSTLPIRNTSVRVIPEYVPFRHCIHLFKELNITRHEAIESLQSTRSFANSTQAAILYDQTLAPLSTNRKMLDLIGITILPTDTGWTTLCMIVHGLAAWDIFITGTDHLCDVEFLSALQACLDSTVRLVPPNNSSPEWINLSEHLNQSKTITPICDRSRFLPVSKYSGTQPTIVVKLM